MTPPTPDRQLGPLGQRERLILDVLVTMHAEYGLNARFTRQAIEHIVGEPVPGSLAGLALKGYVRQESSTDGIVYTVLEAGYALFAGLEGQL
jgi:hypothetical protein